MQGRKNIIIADCEREEILSLVEGLSKNGDRYVIQSYPANGGRTGAISEIKRYLNYFLVSFKVLLHRQKYNDIICWQQFYALIIAFYCNIFRTPKTNRIIAYNYTYKEKKRFKKLYRWFMGKCLNGDYIDYVHVPSYDYAKLICGEFHFPLEKVIVTPFGLDDTYEKYRNLAPPKGYARSGYIVSIGRSNRDFGFLIDAWEGIDYPLVIISDTFEQDTKNSNIEIRRDISGAAQFPYLVNCKAIIIPIDDGSICSGDTVLLKGMCFKRIVLVTEPSTLAEMYIGGGNGLTVKKESDLFRKVVKEIISGKYDYIEESARQSFLQKYSRYNMGAVVADALCKTAEAI